MDLTQPPANPQAPCFWPTGKSQRSHINPAILTSNGHGLMKGGNSALGMWLMDVVILVAFSHADYLPFTFFGPYLVTNTSVKSRSYCRLGKEAGIQIICSDWRPTPAQTQLSFPWEWGQKAVCLYPCMRGGCSRSKDLCRNELLSASRWAGALLLKCLV